MEKYSHEVEEFINNSEDNIIKITSFSPLEKT
jgi:hypothetical protein